MQPTIYTFLIVCPLVFLAGFVDAVAGGGGLISLPAYLLAGVPVHNAVATNKLSSATGTLISTVRLCKINLWTGSWCFHVFQWHSWDLP